MNRTELNEFPDFTKSLLINASIAKVWETITVPNSMEK